VAVLTDVGRPAVGAADWGIEPVPQTSRTLGLFDNASLWANLGFSLVLMVTGALLVPALSLGQAFLAILIGAALGNLLLALAAVVGADTGAPAMVLYRAPLGIRGSYLASGLTVARSVVWGTLQLVIISQVAAAVSDRALGFEARPLWVLVFGVVIVLMALGGPVVVVRQWFRKFALWVALLIGLGFSLMAYTQFGIPALVQRPAAGGWPSFWQGIDLIVALPIAWLPLAPDYSRFARGPRAAFLGTFGGFFVATVWFTMLGVLYVPAVSTSDVTGFVLALGVGVLALLVLLALETDEAFANVYSASVSAQNVAPGAQRRRLSLALGGVCVVLALALDSLGFENFLLLLGSLFVPLFGILAADYFVLRRRRLDVAGLYRNPGAFWYRGGVNPLALGVWLVGFLLYNWISPGTLDWWVSAMEGLFSGLLHLPFPLTEQFSWLGASIPAFLVAFGLYALLGRRYALGEPPPAPVERS
jgi:NCS1 family nucleobase:cation symporter-1